MCSSARAHRQPAAVNTLQFDCTELKHRGAVWSLGLPVLHLLVLHLPGYNGQVPGWIGIAGVERPLESCPSSMP